MQTTSNYATRQKGLQSSLGVQNPERSRDSLTHQPGSSITRKQHGPENIQCLRQNQRPSERCTWSPPTPKASTRIHPNTKLTGAPPTPTSTLKSQKTMLPRKHLTPQSIRIHQAQIKESRTGETLRNRKTWESDDPFFWRQRHNR